MTPAPTATTPTVPLYRTRDLLRDLRPFLAPYKWRFILGSLLRFVSDIAGLYPAFALAFIVNFFTSYQTGDSLHQVWSVLMLWAVAYAVRGFGMYLGKQLVFRIGERISLDAQLRSAERLLLLDVEWHEKENAGNKMKRIQRGGESMNRILRMWVNNFIEIGVNFVGMTIIFASFDRTVAFLMIVFLVTYYLVARAFIKKHSAAVRKVNVKEEVVSGLFYETISNIRTMKIMSMIKPIAEVLRQDVRELYSRISVRVFWGGTGGVSRELWANSFRIGIIVVIIFGILEGRYEIGFLVLFMTYFNRFAESAAELAMTTEEFLTAQFAIGRMVDILEEPVRIDSEEGRVAFPKDWEKIALKNVSFAYGENDVLDNVSFEIKHGERVGIVGLSGAGKSTLFKLLLKEHEQSSGEILVDDVPLNTISKEDYFRHVAAVLQETEVFNFSLRQNIALANSDEAENEALFERSLQIAHVSDFLGKLPNGTETLIGEKGVKLSGGEKQRLGLARAVFKQPEILLLDEATSHLDVESEEKIRASLHEFFKSVTALVIAHRLTTVREMDRIIVIEEGKIIEEGTFDELHARRGRFHELWEKQKL